MKYWIFIDKFCELLLYLQNKKTPQNSCRSVQSLQQFSDSQNVLGPALIRLCFPSVCVWVFFRFSSFLPKTKNMHIRLVGWVVWRLLIASGCPPHQQLVRIGWWLMEDEWRNRLVPVKYIPTCGQCSYCRFGGGDTPKALTSDFAESEQS